MDPHSLIPQQSPVPYPAPFWFIELFKVLGFILHVIPMNLWYAGGIISILLCTIGKGHAKTAGHRIARILPFALAFGINFGIIPLLFIQVAYHQFFYPATILMAWPWFAVFWLVMIAYAGVYLHRLGIEGRIRSRYSSAGGWIAAILFILVGFIFANAISLMTNVGGWWSVFNRSQIAGAPTGFALNLHDPTLIPRWLMMFGLAITTTAVFVIADAAFLSNNETDNYKSYASKLSFMLYSIGLLWFVGFGSWYIFGTRSDFVSHAMHDPLMWIVFPLTALSPGLPWLIIAIQKKSPTRLLASLSIVAQIAVISLNAISRQWLQNAEISPYATIALHPTETQTGGLSLFLILLVLGVALAVWMLSKVIHTNRRESLR